MANIVMFKNNFTTKTVGTLTLGEKLKKLRSDRRISLNEVSKQTLIQAKYLEYLEEGQYDKLPADVYVKGFLRNYAEFLGVDENVLTRAYEKERGIKRNLEESQATAGSKKNGDPLLNSSFIFTPRIIFTSIAAFLFLAGFVYLYNEMSSFAGEPRLVILSPEQSAFVQSNAVEVNGVTDLDAQVFINEHPIMVNDEGKFKENLTLQSGENVINIKARNRFDKETARVITVNASFQDKSENAFADESGAADNIIAENKKPVELEVQVDPGPVWLSVEADGNLVFSGTMLTGANQVFRAENKISVSSGRANATFVKFNGKDIGALGENTGAVRGVVFMTDTKY